MLFYQVIVIGIGLTLAGCDSVDVYDVETKFSKVVRAAPVSNAKKTVYMRVRDLTGHASELSTYLSNNLKQQGYSVVTDPSLATFKLMVNIIKFGKGRKEDYITFMQEVDPKVAAELAKEKHSVKTTRHDIPPSKWSSNANVYSYTNPAGKQEETVEKTTVPLFADRIAIVDVEIINSDGKSLTSRIMAGVNLRGGLVITIPPEIEHRGWTRLIQRLSIAISSLF